MKHKLPKRRKADLHNVTLGGVIDAELGLEGGELRAAERTLHQIMKVSGRAGRGEKPGKVFLQTHAPGAAVMQALITGDAESFYAGETEAPRVAGAPPLGRHAAIVVSSEAMDPRSEARRVGPRCGRICSTRWARFTNKKK